MEYLGDTWGDEGIPKLLEELCEQAVKTIGVWGWRPSFLTSLTHQGSHAVRAIRQARPKVYRSLLHHWALGRSSISITITRELSRAQNMFHVFQLCKYIPDLTHMIEPKSLQLQEDLTHEEQQIAILDCWEKQLHNKVVLFVKVLLAKQSTADATWETEEGMLSKYHHLLTGPVMSEFWQRNFF